MRESPVCGAQCCVASWAAGSERCLTTGSGLLVVGATAAAMVYEEAAMTGDFKSGCMAHVGGVQMGGGAGSGGFRFSGACAAAVLVVPTYDLCAGAWLVGDARRSCDMQATSVGWALVDSKACPMMRGFGLAVLA